MKVLLSAFSCEPWRGSEPEVGFRSLLVAAEQHDVWVLTSATGMPKLLRYFEDHPFKDNVHLVPHPAVPPGEDEGRLGLVPFHRMYDRWQRQIAPLALDLDRRVDFDLVHHVTIATVWTRSGAATVGKPFVWGPVGGSVAPPPRLALELGTRGLAQDLARVAGRRLLSRMPHARIAPRRARVVLAQNAVTAEALRTSAPVRLLSNATAVDVTHIPLPRDRTADLAFVGRLLGWKGTTLALRAFRRVRHPDARLRFFGSGPDVQRLDRMARRWNIRDRVVFEGWRDRDEMLGEVAGCAALVHPSLHDEAGLCVAEALSLGTPAICLDHGGPAEVIRQLPDSPGFLVPPSSPEQTVSALAEAMNRCVDQRAPIPSTPRPVVAAFHRTLLAAYEAAAAGQDFDTHAALRFRRSGDPGTAS